MQNITEPKKKQKLIEMLGQLEIAPCDTPFELLILIFNLNG